MKKSYSLVIIAAFVFTAVSCSKVIQQSGAELRFGTTEVKSAQINDLNTDGTTFSVYSVRTDASTYNNPLTIFDNETVTRVSGVWETENVRMWVKGHDYYFAALYPTTNILNEEGINVVYNGPTDKYVKITDYSLWNQDLMVSAPIMCNADEYIQNNSPIPLTFNHILTDLRFKVKLTPELEGSANPTATINSVKFYGLTTTGNYTENIWEPSENIWGADNTPFTGSNITISNGTTVDLFEGDIFTIPQNITTDMKIDFEYTTENREEIKTQTFKIADLLKEAETEFKQAKVYTFTFRINGDIIIFDVPQVEEWKEATGGIITVE